MPLTMLNSGETAEIKRIKGRDDVKRFLENLGFVTGEEVKVVSSNEARDNSTEYRKRATNPENTVFSGFSLYSENLSDTLKSHENVPVTNR